MICFSIQVGVMCDGLMGKKKRIKAKVTSQLYRLQTVRPLRRRAEVTCRARCRGPSRGGTGSSAVSPGRSVSSAPRRPGASDTCCPSSAQTP